MELTTTDKLAQLERVMEPAAIDASFVFAKSNIKDKVAKLEEAINHSPVCEVPIHHEVNGGMYARTALIPAGVTFTGAVHTKDHINIVIGDITVLSDAGPVRYSGHHVLPCKAGSKRVAVTHADTYWTTMIATSLTNISEIEDEICEDSTVLQTRKAGLTFDKLKEI